MAKLDIVLFGATGFTGSLAAKYLSRVPGLRWAVAGRSPAKLDALRATLEGSASPPSHGIVASPSSEPFDGIKVANAAAVVLSTAGPFSLYSDVLVRCCAMSGGSLRCLTGISTRSANWSQTIRPIRSACQRPSRVNRNFVN